MMKLFHLFLLVAVQLSLLASSMAQITFTREWVTGKRSETPKLRLLVRPDSQGSACQSLLPVVDYLLEVEKSRQRSCSPTSKSYEPLSYLRKLVPLGEGSNNPGYEDPNMDAIVSPRLQKSS